MTQPTRTALTIGMCGALFLYMIHVYKTPQTRLMAFIISAAVALPIWLVYPYVIKRKYGLVLFVACWVLAVRQVVAPESVGSYGAVNGAPCSIMAEVLTVSNSTRADPVVAWVRESGLSFDVDRVDGFSGEAGAQQLNPKCHPKALRTAPRSLDLLAHWGELLGSTYNFGSEWILFLEDDAEPVVADVRLHACALTRKYADHDLIWVDHRNLYPFSKLRYGGLAGILVRARSMPRIRQLLQVDEYLCHLGINLGVDDILSDRCTTGLLRCVSSWMIRERGATSSLGSNDMTLHLRNWLAR